MHNFFSPFQLVQLWISSCNLMNDLQGFWRNLSMACFDLTLTLSLCFLSGVCMVQWSTGGACGDFLVAVCGGHGLHARDAAPRHLG